MLDWKYRPKSDGERAAETEQKAKAEQEREETPEGFASKNAKTITFTVMVAMEALRVMATQPTDSP